jgi:ABC-type nitrate/sulfonate/bicarbonate transport system permease component
VGALAIWELVVRTGLVSEREVPPLSEVATALAGLLQQSEFWLDVGVTLQAAAQGLLVGTALGVVVGALMGRFTLVDAALRPTVEFLRPVPSIALVPLMVLLFGQTTETVWVIAAFGCLWPMLIQTSYGVRAIEPLALETARVFQIRRWKLLRHVLLPAMLPYLMTGLRVTTSLSLMVAVSVQIIVGAPGLGQAIVFEQRSLDLPTMFALIVVTGVIGFLIHVAFGRFESRFMRWHAGWGAGTR